MHLLNTTDYRRTPLLSTLIVAPAALALIVALLWFGSIRNPDPVSTDKGRLYLECAEGSQDFCEDATLIVTPLGNGTGELNGVQIPGISLDTGTPFITDGEQENGRCIFIGNPCYQDPGLGYIGQSAVVQVNRELRTY